MKLRQGFNLWILLFLLSSTAALPAQVATIEGRSTVFSYPNDDPYDRANLYGFNHAPSVSYLGNGRLMALWFSGPFEASVHQMILSATSEDNGATWSKAEVFFDEPRKSDFDPCFLVGENFALAFFSTGRWDRYPFVGMGPQAAKKLGHESFQIQMRRTTDNGKTWSPPVAPLPLPGWNCRVNGIVLSSGELLLPIHYLGKPQKAAALISGDGGKTWEKSQDVPVPDKKMGIAEPSVAECSDKSLLMVLRNPTGKLWISRSTDKGRTWTEAQPTELPAGISSPTLLRTNTGSLVLIHNPTTPPLRHQLTLRISKDDGKSWSQPLMVAQVTPAGDQEEVYSRQVSMPSVCQLPDNTLIVVWAQIELSPRRQQGIIQSARIRLP